MNCEGVLEMFEMLIWSSTIIILFKKKTSPTFFLIQPGPVDGSSCAMLGEAEFCARETSWVTQSLEEF